MTSAQIQSLLRRPEASLSEKRAVAFLDANFKTSDQLDLASLERAADSAKRDHDDLSAKLEEAERSRTAIIERSLSLAKTALSEAQELSLTRHELVDRLSTLAEQVLPPPGSKEETTLIELERLHGQLEEMEQARDYARIVLRLLELSEAAEEQFKSWPRPKTFLPTAPMVYRSLQSFVAEVTNSAPPSSTLSEFAKSLQRQTWGGVRNLLSSKLLEAAGEFKWPQPFDYSYDTPGSFKLITFIGWFQTLLDLQRAGEVWHADETDWPPDSGVYPFQALIRPIAQRFRYHFEGTRATNRLDKPEWYLQHMLAVTKEHKKGWMPLIDRILYQAKWPEIDAQREYTRLLLPILSRHILLSTAQILSAPSPDPSLLAHTIYQTLEFDAALKEDGFGLDATWECKRDETKEWKGLAGELLGNAQIFGAWLEGERKFAQDQYKSIIESPDAWTIVDASESDNEDNVPRITNSARRLCALVEQVTDRYSPLPSFSQRTSFLTSAQLPLLESYHGRISSSLDAFEAFSSSFVRAVPGALAGQVAAGFSGKELTGGVEGADRLVKAWVSSEGIIAGLERWGEDVFFLELWTEINVRASLRSRAAATSSLPDPRPADENATEGTIFDELITKYKALSKRTEGMIVRHVTGEVEGALRNYFVLRWDAPISDELGLPPSLIPGLTALSTHLTYLSITLPPSILPVIYRQISTHIANHILSRAVFHGGRGRFTPSSGEMFVRECQAWIDVCKGALAEKIAKVERGWERLLEASRILGLGTVEYGPAVKVAWDGTKRDYDGFVEALRLRELRREEVQNVMRARADCSR